MGFRSDDRFNSMDSEEDAVIPKFIVRRRFWYGVVYGLTLLGGLCALADPSRLVEEQISRPISIVFGLSIVLAALGCLFSSFTDMWIGEYSFIPLLASAVVLYGGAAIVSAYDDEASAGLILVGYGFFMCSFGILFAMRWFDVRLIKINATQGENLKR